MFLNKKKKEHSFSHIHTYVCTYVNKYDYESRHPLLVYRTKMELLAKHICFSVLIVKNNKWRPSVCIVADDTYVYMCMYLCIKITQFIVIVVFVCWSLFWLLISLEIMNHRLFFPVITLVVIAFVANHLKAFYLFLFVITPL